MMLNIKLEGFPEEILRGMVELGIASNKTEAIRLALMDYNEHHRIRKVEQYVEDELVVRKMKQIDREIKKGKRKVLSEEEVLKKYPHLRDV